MMLYYSRIKHYIYILRKQSGKNGKGSNNEKTLLNEEAWRSNCEPFNA